MELPFMTISKLLSSSLLCLAVWILWKAFKRLFFVSDLDNIPGPPSKSFLKGHFFRIFGESAADFHQEVLADYGQVAAIEFPLGGRKILISDPKALHHILVKDNHAYQSTTWFIATIGVVLGPGLLGSLGEEHRKQRKMLNPVFSIAHMRNMVPIFYRVTYKLRDAIASKVKNGRQEIDILPWLTRTALELIGQSGFGYSFDSLTDDAVPHTYAISVKKIIPALSKLLVPRIYLLPILWKIGSLKFQKSVLDRIPGKVVHDIRKLVDIIDNTSMEIFESKQKALAEGKEAFEGEIAQGKDLMSLLPPLVRANMQAEEADKLSNEELLGQMSTFTFGATDTTSSALSRIFWLLSEHQDAQDKLRNEICEAREKHGDCDYDVLSSLPYLDAVCRETLRLYPPIIAILRTSLTDIVLPLSTPVKGRDGREMSEIFIPNGTDFVISTVASNTNPDIWGPDSYEWKPERWLQPLPEAVTNARIPGVYAHLMTFNGGGRACIGFKFSQLEMKVVLSLLIESFKIFRSDKQIHWRTHGVSSPFILDAMSQPRQELPIIFERI